MFDKKWPLVVNFPPTNIQQYLIPSGIRSFLFLTQSLTVPHSTKANVLNTDDIFIPLLIAVDIGKLILN